METFIQEISTFSAQIIQFSWLPFLIWTLLSGIIWATLHFFSTIHPQYQYHGRLALLFALPIGLLGLGFLRSAEALFFTSPSESGLSFIYVTAPFELSVTASNSSTISTLEIAYAVSFLLVITGIVWFGIRHLLQWLQLKRFKSSCTFLPIQDISGLNQSTVSLIRESQKNVFITFRNDELIPVTFGAREPVIVVPESIRKDTDKLNLVLQHELSHIKQNDFISNIAVTLTQIVFWFHPFVHLLKRELIDYREIRCDSLVLSNQSVSRKKYASLLLELLPMPNINKELSVNMAQESSNLKKRIQMITQQSTNRSIPKRSSAAIFTFIILCTAIAMSCTDMQLQSNETSDSGILSQSQSEQDFYKSAEQMPELIGGLESIQQEVRYPEEAVQNGVEGMVYVRFIVNKEGNVENAEIIRGIGAGADEEALRVVRQAKFEPAYQNGEPVRMQYALPISFRLNTPAEEVDADQVYEIVDEMPDLIGGFESLRDEIQYPEEAKQAGIEGRVFMTFVVNKQGDVEDAKVDRGLGAGTDEEALRVIRQAKFEPGYQAGEPVRVQYSIAISFVLPQEESQ